jgi:periplasmic protein TonB
MFRHVVEPFASASGNRKYTVPLSIVAHSLAIAALIIVPLVATDTLVLPRRLVMDAFPTRPPLPPSPPPPPRGVRIEQQALTRPAIPLEAPPSIIAEIPIQSEGRIADLDYTTGLVEGGDYSAPPPPPASPRTSIDAPVRPGSVIKRPVKVRDLAPTYPAVARAARVEGIVIVEATIGPNGKVQDARILRSVPLLDAAALDAVRQWEYTPTLLNGIPVAVVMTVTVDFKLR